MEIDTCIHTDLHIYIGFLRMPFSAHVRIR